MLVYRFDFMILKLKSLTPWMESIEGWSDFFWMKIVWIMMYPPFRRKPSYRNKLILTGKSWPKRTAHIDFRVMSSRQMALIKVKMHIIFCTDMTFNTIIAFIKFRYWVHCHVIFLPLGPIILSICHFIHQCKGSQ